MAAVLWNQEICDQEISIGERERALRGIEKFLAFLFIVSSAMLGAQTTGPASVSSSGSSQEVIKAVISSSVPTSGSDGPVGEVRKNRSWEFGPFVNGGVGLGDRNNYGFFSVGFQGGKVLTPVLHAGILTGQFELGANIMPFR